MKLGKWVEETGLTWREAAQVLGVGHAWLHQIVHDKRRPGWDAMERILRATKGAVQPNDFVKKWPKGCKP